MEDSLLPSVYLYPHRLEIRPLKATQGSNSASQLFTVTSLIPVIVLDPTFGPVGTPVDITGAGFTPSSTAVMTFNGITVTTTPILVTTNTIGVFSASFTVPSSSTGLQNVVATQGSNSATKIFNVTSNLAASSRSSLGIPSNQSNTTLSLPPANQSNGSVPIVTISSFVSTKPNGSIAAPLNTSSAQATENMLTAPSAKEMNNTSLIAPPEAADQDVSVNGNNPENVVTKASKRY